jgi:hypothetical protein
MKISMAISFFWLALAISVNGQPSPLTLYGLQGNVKNVEEKTIGYTNYRGKDKKNFESATFTMYFDKDGRLRSRRVATSDRTTEESYDYDRKGTRKAVSQTHRAFAGPNELSLPSVYASVFKFEKEKNCLTETTYFAFRQTGPDFVVDKPGESYEYCFDDTGRLTKKAEMDEKGRLVRTTEFYYRNEGPPTQEVESISGRASAIYRITYEFDSNKNWIKRTKVADATGQQDPVYKSVTTRNIDYFK